MKDLALKYAQNDYNCAESVVLAANEYYGLNIDPRDVHLVSGFGAGMQCGDLCGGLAGAVAIIAMKYVENRAHEDRPGLRNKVTKLIRSFEAAAGSRLCKDIKPKFYTPETHCYKTIMMASEVLENTIDEIEKEMNALN